LDSRLYLIAAPMSFGANGNKIVKDHLSIVPHGFIALAAGTKGKFVIRAHCISVVGRVYYYMKQLPHFRDPRKSARTEAKMLELLRFSAPARSRSGS
jgi:hypothetical protein